MKRLIFNALMVFMVLSCMSTRDDSQQLKIKTIELIKDGKLDQINTCGTLADVNTSVIKKFADPIDSIDNMKIALSEGYLPLLEDISQGKFSCLNEKDISGKYKSTDWETRNIGFANWPTRAKGAFILHHIRILKYQILIMKLCDKKGLRPIIEEKQTELQNTITEINEMAKEKNWVD